MKPVLAVDMDDCILNFCEPLLEFHNRTYGSSHTREGMWTFDLSKFWECAPEESIKRVFEFYETPEHWNTDPIPGAINALRRLKEDYSLYIVTARPDDLEQGSRQWLERHFPNMFEDIYFTNHFHGSGKKRTKLEVCREINAQALIDDSQGNAECVSQGGIPVYLLDQPWNKETSGALITRVFNWDEIVERLCKKEKRNP